MANQMNLLKYRNYEEHDVINLYATIEGDLTKGTILEYVSADPDNQNGFGVSFANTPGYAFSKDYVVNWKVQTATAYSKKIAGILLNDVVTTITDPWSVDARFVDPAKLAEKQVVVSGRAVPFATRGWFEVSGIDTTSGAPAPGSGAYLSNSTPGTIACGNTSNTGEVRVRIGTFMTSTGLFGGVLVKFNPSF